MGRLVDDFKDIVVILRQKIRETLITINVHSRDIVGALKKDSCRDI
jgi:hypothetical protein